MMKTVFLTGGSSGIGKATAELFASNGYEVYVFCRRDINHNIPNIHYIKCDVIEELQVTEAVNKALTMSGRHVDVLICNAGCGISGPIEFTPNNEVRRQFDVNFFGTLNVIKAVLPTMREQHSGLILITSSVAAVLSIPYQAFYSASKSALNSLVLALRNEVADFGIKVAAIMPGDVSTGFTDARSKTTEGEDVYTHCRKAVEAMENDERNGMKTTELAEKIFSISQKNNPAPFYTAGLQYHLFVFLEKILPTRLSNWIVGQLYR